MLTGKRCVFALMCCLLTAALFSSHLGAQEVTDTLSVPHIVIDAAEYNAGEIYEGENILHSFTVKNTGTAELIIKDVKAG